MKRILICGTGIMALLLYACNNSGTADTPPKSAHTPLLTQTSDLLDYTGLPKDKKDRSALLFSDQGAWFAYGIPDHSGRELGFSGPFLLTQDNGIWSSKQLVSITLTGKDDTAVFKPQKSHRSHHAYHSHLEQTFENDSLRVGVTLVFSSGHTALQQLSIENMADRSITVQPRYSGTLFGTGNTLDEENGFIRITSSRSPARGYLHFSDFDALLVHDSLSYEVHGKKLQLQAGEKVQVQVAQTFIFPEYSWEKETQYIISSRFDSILQARKQEKETQLQTLKAGLSDTFSSDAYFRVQAKALLTLQNNWRIPAGELKHQGLFPSYHYEWFHGFWSWDSWKHAVGLSYYNLPLARDQVRAMFDFQSEDGFIVDCIYRDTTIEAHNYRDTKPPLAAWAVLKIYQQDKDTAFVKEMYPKLKKYHRWWYEKRDHDGDGICEYGSTDGTVIAAKWESGMDNAIRFDDTKMLKNTDGAYSMNQESVDLNAYLYAEKQFLSTLALVALQEEDARVFQKEAETLRQVIQTQFFNEEAGWFNDTSIDGSTFIEGAGSEGWIPLWANAASKEQAEIIKNGMMDPEKFFTTVPFQTMAMNHPKFNPEKGYWRGPNWLDQAYFGIKGLRNYGYTEEADKATERILRNARGVMDQGSSIRENYHPVTGQGLYAENFSWSAAHLIMMLSGG